MGSQAIRLKVDCESARYNLLHEYSFRERSGQNHYHKSRDEMDIFLVPKSKELKTKNKGKTRSKILNMEDVSGRF